MYLAVFSSRITPHTGSLSIVSMNNDSRVSLYKIVVLPVANLCVGKEFLVEIAFMFLVFCFRGAAKTVKIPITTISHSAE